MRWLGVVVLVLAAGASTAHAGTLAFDARDCDERDCGGAIWTVDDDGSGLRRVTAPTPADPYHDPGGGRYGSPEVDTAPAWTVDGKLLFERTDRRWGNAKRIFVVDPARAGSDQPAGIPGTDGWWNDETPAAALVPGVIVFSSTRDDGSDAGGPSRIWVSTPAGARPITPGILDQRPTLSPDGLRVLFVRNVLPGVASPTGVWSTTLAGGVMLPVVAGDDVLGAHEAEWSRDARRLAAQLPGRGLVVFRTLQRPSEFGEAWRFLTWGRGSRFFATEGGVRHSSPVVYELDADRPAARPREVFSLPSGRQVGDAAWKPDPLEVVPLPVDVPPLLSSTADLSPLGPLPRKSGGTARAAAAGSGDRFAVMAADPDGVRKIRAAVRRRARRGCRFLTARGRLGKPRRCGRPVTLDASDPTRWRRLTSSLPRGRYRLTVTARDRDGSRTRKALVRTVVVAP